MKDVAVYEAKTRLSELLVEVEHGAQFTITRRGLAVARLVSMQSAVHPATLPTAQQAATRAANAQRERVSSALAALQGLRQGVSLDMPLADAIGHGRD